MEGRGGKGRGGGVVFFFFFPLASAHPRQHDLILAMSKHYGVHMICMYICTNTLPTYPGGSRDYFCL